METKRLSRLGYRTWYTKAKEEAKYFGLDLTDISDTIDFFTAVCKGDNWNSSYWEMNYRILKFFTPKNLPIIQKKLQIR